MKSVMQEILEIETAVDQAGYKMRDMFYHANISPQSWCGWKRGDVSPSLKNFKRVLAVVERMQSGNLEIPGTS